MSCPAWPNRSASNRTDHAERAQAAAIMGATKVEAAMANRETITRRVALAATAASVAALGGSEASAQAQTRKTFVLIHGAYHGGWCWRKVTDILERAGHKVYAPSLTGLADRSRLLSTNIHLDPHIADIANLFKWEDIKDGCLAVHSYGGWPGSGALEQIGDPGSSIVCDEAVITT